MSPAATKKKQGKTVRYYSVSPHYQLIRLRADERITPAGKVYVANQSAYEQAIVQFNDGWLEVREGEQVLPSGPPGEDGEPQLEDVVTFLERQPTFGNLFHRQEEVKPPVDQGQMDAITEAILNADVEALRAIHAAEADSYERPEILGPVAKALEKLAG